MVCFCIHASVVVDLIGPVRTFLTHLLNNVAVFNLQHTRVSASFTLNTNTSTKLHSEKLETMITGYKPNTKRNKIKKKYIL